jgi:lysylphosphatidylglycerol synthetase-like protein (DUF2156 family)
VVFDYAPSIAAGVSFVVGAAALVAATSARLRPIPGFDLIEHLIDEAPEFTASVVGVALMALAVGLRRRLDTAWAASSVLLAFLAFYAVVRHEHYVGAAACGLACIGLLASRSAFFRHAGAASLAPSRSWYLAAAAVFVAAAIGGLLWAAERPGFARAPWWALITGPHLGRPGRALLIAALAVAAPTIWRLLLSPAKPHPPPPDADEVARAAAIIASADAPRPEAALAMLGDKAFLFTPQDGAFMMYARSGGSQIAMGGPVGKRGAWREALAAFRDEAERTSSRAVIYAAPAELLPDLLDLGFKVEKVGENAVVDLKQFSLAGRKRQDVRTARRRFVEREQASFEIDLPPHDAHRLAAVAPISEAWLKAQRGSEKGFSLGRFDPAFLQHGPLAIVRAHGKAIAFATLWVTHDRSWASVDLMRHDPAGTPSGVMDFLFAELLLWAQDEGYAQFDLGMAPLSGLAEERHAPLFARFGRFVFERAGPFYNFEGLRRFKEKFATSWEPRYLAAPGGSWSMPLVLAEVAILTSRDSAARLRKLAESDPS